MGTTWSFFKNISEVGAVTETEMKDKKLRLEDAINATRGPCVVTQVKTEAKDGYNSIQVIFNRLGILVSSILNYSKSSSITKPMNLLVELCPIVGGAMDYIKRLKQKKNFQLDKKLKLLILFVNFKSVDYATVAALVP